MDAATLSALYCPAQTVIGLEKTLQKLYRLTRAEAQLAQALLQGASLQEVADRSALSIHTVRSHYKAAAAKLGAGRQAEFVRSVLLSPALLHGDGRQEHPQR